MYTGPQNSELVKAVDALRTIPNVRVKLVIISAGFGLLEEEELVPPYDCSFTNMKMTEVRKRSNKLRIRDAFARVVNTGFDLVYLALGKRYLASLGKDLHSVLEAPTVTFHGFESDLVVRIPCGAETVKAFSKRGHTIHGVVGFKGDLLRVLAHYALEKPNPEREAKKWINLKYLLSVILRLGGLNH
jgi:hypothetical protein